MALKDSGNIGVLLVADLRNMQQPKSLMTSGTIQVHRKTILKTPGLDAKAAFDQFETFMPAPADGRVAQEAVIRAGFLLC